MRKLKFALFSGGVLSLMLLAGHPQMALYSFLGTFLYASYKAYMSTPVGRIRRLLSFLFIVFGVGIGIAAIQIIPTVEFASLSERIRGVSVLGENFSFHTRNLISLISAYYFGNPAEGTYQVDIKSFGVFWENSTYLGLLPIFLVVLLLPRLLIKGRKDTDSLFFIFLAIFSFLVMLGVKTPLIFILAKVVPFFSIFRFPVRFNLFFLFSLSFLAARGFDLFLGQLKSKRKGMFTIVFFLVLIIDLYMFADRYISFIPTPSLNEPPRILTLLGKDKEIMRIYSITQYQKGPYTGSGWKDLAGYLNFRESLPPNDNLLYGLDSFSDRGWFEGGLSVAKRNDLERYILLGAYFNPDLNAKVLGMYNVKYLISYDNSPSPDFEKIGEILYKNKRVLPRAYIVPEAINITSQDEYYKIVSDLSFNPERSVIIESKGKTAAYTGNLSEFKERNRVEGVSYRNNEVSIVTKVQDEGLLVLSDTFYPDWRASVDGREVPILIANQTVRAIHLNPGDSEIRFLYKPRSFAIGGAISLVTLTLLLLSLIWKTKRDVKEYP